MLKALRYWNKRAAAAVLGGSFCQPFSVQPTCALSAVAWLSSVGPLYQNISTSRIGSRLLLVTTRSDVLPEQGSRKAFNAFPFAVWVACIGTLLSITAGYYHDWWLKWTGANINRGSQFQEKSSWAKWYQLLSKPTQLIRHICPLPFVNIKLWIENYLFNSVLLQKAFFNSSIQSNAVNVRIWITCGTS